MYIYTYTAYQDISQNLTIYFPWVFAAFGRWTFVHVGPEYGRLPFLEKKDLSGILKKERQPRTAFLMFRYLCKKAFYDAHIFGVMPI